MDWPFFHFARLRCVGTHRLRQDSPHSCAGAIDSQQGGKRRRDVYGRHHAVICAGNECRTEKFERYMAVVAVSRKMGCATNPTRKLIRPEVDVQPPADIRRITMRYESPILSMGSFPSRI
jgi:hypothetical protein